MLLDFKTLSFMVVISSFLYAITIAFFALQANHYKGIRLYMWGAVCAALGFLLTTIYTQFPQFFALRFGAASFLTLACYFYYLGIARFLDFNFNARGTHCLLITGLISLLYYIFFDPTNSIGYTIIPFYGIVFYGFACYLLWLRRHENFASSIYFLIISLVFIILVFAARCYYMIAYDVESSFQNQALNTRFLLSIFISGYLRNVGFIMMVSHRLYQDLREAASQDFLTRVYSRRATQELLDQQFNQFQRYKSLCSLILLDIDYFKLVNDNHGHETGDKVLQEVAMLLKNQLRNVDTLGRWGGEEFLIILPNIGIAEAIEVAEKLRNEIAKEKIVGLNCTISLGVKMLDNNDHTIDEAIKRADNALYSAKHKGRNCVVVSEPTL